MGTSDLQRLAAEVVRNSLLAVFEPAVLQFTPMHEKDVARVAKAILRATKSDPAWFPEARPVNRNGFLLGCLDYTEDLLEEHLIVGFGYRYGTTTKITHVMHNIGGRHSVSLPDEIICAVQRHYQQDARHEVIVFHNHPKNFLNRFLDNAPLTSSADRTVLATHGLRLPQLIRSLTGNGRVLFYLGENGFVRQFLLPNIP